MGGYSELLRHFVSPFYIANALIILTYLPVRLHWSQHGLSKYTRLTDPAEVYDWETQCGGMILFVLSIKSLRERFTLDVLLADVFLYCKAAILTITFNVDPRVCAYFGIVFLLAYLMAPQPYRDYIGPHRTELLTSSTFTEQVTDKVVPTKWLVLFFAPGKVGRQVNAVFASLSLSYADEKLHFGRVNTQAPDAATYNGISSTSSFYGATLVMYKDGQETCRLPREATTDQSVMSADNIAKVFELDAAANQTKMANMSRNSKRQQ